MYTYKYWYVIYKKLLATISTVCYSATHCRLSSSFKVAPIDIDIDIAMDIDTRQVIVFIGLV